MTLVVLLATLPVILWQQGVETAPALKQSGVVSICVPASKAAQWRKAGFSVIPFTRTELESRTKVPAPRIAAEPQDASATRSPWVIANGSQFIRNTTHKYFYDLPTGKGALAVAEAYVYGADAILKIEPHDLQQTGQMLAFLGKLEPLNAEPLVDFVVVDDGKSLLSEVMNLLVRRNLLFKVTSAPDLRFRINVQLGAKDYPEAEAANPAEFALKVRAQLTDEKRLVRIYGTEVVICRLTGTRSRIRLHLLNYGGSTVSSLRVRLRGSYFAGKAHLFEEGDATLEDHIVTGGATEFTLPQMGAYAVVDLEAKR